VNCAEQVTGRKVSLYFPELMQQLLEPQFIRLMNDNEEHLIVFRRTRTRFLKREQILQVKITRVSQW
jgi:hypothetical protein